MASWFRRSRARASGQVGLTVTADGIALAHVRSSADGRPALEECDFLPAGADLEAAVADRGLRGARTVLMLTPGDYALRALDAPDVPQAELRAAVRWSLQDLIEFDVEDALVDVFHVPGQEGRRTERRVYAVAAPRERVLPLVRAVREAGLGLVGIELAELGLRNLAALHPAGADGVVSLALGHGLGLLTVTRGSELYVARWVDADLEALAESATKDAGAVGIGEEALEALLLEVQRSLDYYQHDLRQRPATTIALAPAAIPLDGLAERIAAELGLQAVPLDPPALLEGADVAPSQSARVLPAIGAALRGDAGQQIDLMQFDAIGQPPRLAPDRMLRIAGWAAAGLAVATLGTGTAAWVQGRALSRLEHRVADLRSHVEASETQLSAHLDTREIDTRVQVLEADLRARRRLAGALGDASVGVDGFSEHLAALGHGDVDGLWLDAFELRRGGAWVAVEGQSLEPRLVPRFVDRLVEQPVFGDVRFATLKLDKMMGEGGAHGFRICSDAEGES